MGGRSVVLGLVVIAAAAWTGCGGNSEPGEGDDQNATAGDCQVFSVKDQAMVPISELLNPKDKNQAKVSPKDPVLTKILKSCPENYKKIQADLKALDGNKCQLQMRNVSERATQLNHPEVGRALVSRTCSGSSEPELF